VDGVNLSTANYAPRSVFAAPTTGPTSAALVSTGGDTFAMSLSGGGSDSISISSTGAWAAGDSVTLRLGERSVSYTVQASDLTGSSSTNDIVAVGLKNALDALGIAGLTVGYDSANPGVLTFNNGGTRDLTVSGQFGSAGSGSLSALQGINVTTSATGADLASVEAMIQTAVQAAASFGSVQKQIDIQSEFVGKLTDAMKSGIGAMVDANMEEASARLQALQVQQQLATQSLSIANQAPQSILSLFR
jgi:flagellin